MEKPYRLASPDGKSKLLLGVFCAALFAAVGCARQEPQDSPSEAASPPTPASAEETSTEGSEPPPGEPTPAEPASSPAESPTPQGGQAKAAEESASPDAAAQPAAPVDDGRTWAHWRGPAQRGVSGNHDLPGSWSQDGENLVWQQPYGGRSCPAVVNGRVCMIGVGGDGVTTHERVVCFDAESGDLLWEYPFNVFLTDIVANRVGWASLAADPETGYVYAHGVQDLLLCLDAEGKLVWSRSLGEEFGSVTGYGGRVHTPVIDEDRLIISFLNSSWGQHGVPRHRYLALDKRTGKVLWWAAPGERPLDTTYSTPVFAVIDGQRLMIAGNADGSIYAMKARTGEMVWRFRLSKRGINSSCVVDETRVYACHGEENLDTPTMGRVVCIDATGQGDVTETHEIWRHDGIQVGYSSPALHEGRLYVADNSANLFCFDSESGSLRWEHKLGRVGRGSTPVLADGKIYVTEYQSFHILQPSDQGCESLDVERFTGPSESVEVWGSPAVAGGRVYFNTMDSLYCIGKESWTGQNEPLPRSLAEQPLAEDAAPAWIQIVPAEIALQPGEQVSFDVYAYDEKGRSLGPTRATFLAGLSGQLHVEGGLQSPTETGFQAPAENQGQAGLVKATVGSLTSEARVRVIPQMPLEVDFEDVEPGSVPPHWVISRAKFAVAEQDGNKMFRKSNTNPATPVARAIAFLGPPDWNDYTIEADCMGTEARFNLPEMGLVNSRYKLILRGNYEQLAITTWDALPRLVESVPYPIEPEVWYRMKLRVEIDDETGRGLIRGKVWERNQAEPDEWTVEVEDPMPHRQGAPGLYSYSLGITDDAPGTEIFFDDVRVESNQP